MRGRSDAGGGWASATAQRARRKRTRRTKRWRGSGNGAKSGARRLGSAGRRAPGRSTITTANRRGREIASAEGSPPPTQFYHRGLLLGNRAVDPSIRPHPTTGGRSFVANDSGPQECRPDRRFLRPRRRRKGRAFEPPSKRTSPSFEREGPPPPSSLPPSDRRCRRRIRRTLGGGEEERETPARTPRHLVAIRARAAGGGVDGRGGGGSTPSGKAPAVSSLSHRELEEVLSKSRKNRSRKEIRRGCPKRKDTRRTPTTSIAGAVPNRREQVAI
jgi:hypothetical protein